MKDRRIQLDYKPVQEAVERLAAYYGDVLQDDLGIDALLEKRGIAAGTTKWRRLRREYQRSVKRGTGGIYHVDEICCGVLRKHPAELYGEEWFEA